MGMCECVCSGKALLFFFLILKSFLRESKIYVAPKLAFGYPYKNKNPEFISIFKSSLKLGYKKLL